MRNTEQFYSSFFNHKYAILVMDVSMIFQCVIQKFPLQGDTGVGRGPRTGGALARHAGGRL
jgi:hypothetical protein